MSGFFEKLVRDLQNRVGNMLIRAVITATSENLKLQEIQMTGRSGETKDGVEHLLPYGFSMRVKKPDAQGRGAETVVLAVEPDLRMALPAADRRYRPRDLAEGEVVFYTHEDRDPDGANPGQCRLHFKNGRLVALTCTGMTIDATDVEINATDAEINADTVTVNASEKAVINGDDIHLGGEGGERLARIGDTVEVGAGSSAGSWPITSGSAKVRAL